jgi:hypothetical protein
MLFCLLTLGMATIATGYQRRWRQDWRSVGRQGVPTWEVEKPFVKDVFTFARVKYNSRGYRDRWAIDFRDSDLNFSLRLQQLTTIKVNPEPVVVELTDPKLFDYPFLYMIEPGELIFAPEEAKALRQYLLNGGFMMVDDFWGDEEYANFANEMKLVFPELEPEVVPLEHDIFQCVYPLKEKPQIPSVGIAQRGAPYGITWESRYGSDTTKANYRAIYDKSGRIMVFICHNTDLGDGWEQEGVDPWYFENFSVKKAYPMGINIATYAMTH